MSNDNSNLKLWAKSLGFERVDDEAFIESSNKLVPPSFRNIWRHIGSHVLPSDKANYIRKHCLLWKLEQQKSINQDIKADLKNLKQYSKYVEINELNVKSAYLDKQIETSFIDMKEMTSKLEDLGNKKQKIKEKEKEKIIKCKLIEIKNKSTLKEINNLKEMKVLLDHFIKAIDVIFPENNDTWSKEVIENWKKLPHGNEIEKLNEILRSLMQTHLNVKTGITRGNKKKNLLEMQLVHIQKFLEADVCRKSYGKLQQKVDDNKEKIVQKFKEHHRLQQEDMSSFNIILTSNIQSIINRTEADALKNFKNNWVINEDSSVTDQYLSVRNEISELEEEIENKTKNIETSIYGQEKLVTFCVKAQEMIKGEPKTAMFKQKSSLKQLAEEIRDLNILQEEIALFIKTPIRKDLGPDKKSTNRSAGLDSSKRFKEIVEAPYVPVLELPNIEKNAAKDIANIKGKEIIAKERLGNLLENNTHLAKDINKLKSECAMNLEFWKEQYLAEAGTSCSKEYMLWRKRCKEAIKTLQCDNEEFNNLEEF